MKNLRIVSTLLAAIMLTSVVACAPTAKSESVGEYIDDSAITAGVKSAFAIDPTLKATEINVETYKGIVQLSGFVAQQADIANASTVARNVKGVKSVKNDIRMK
ncbi:MAG TPA: BON domain-containing protein [Telluria sp.]|jgi:osmotically-inducible protein OsmY|nr:BON domain-containing protein [Telluria sp.]